MLSCSPVIVIVMLTLECNFTPSHFLYAVEQPSCNLYKCLCDFLNIIDISTSIRAVNYICMV